MNNGKHNIGDFFEGGIIAYIDNSTGHGLIASEKDLDLQYCWYNGSNLKVKTKDGIGFGKTNTDTIIELQGEGIYAAKACKDLTLNGFNDWFLPNKEELHQLYLNKNIIGGFVGDCYWSSSEFYNFSGLSQDFSNGFQEGTFKEKKIYVRAVRTF